MTLGEDPSQGVMVYNNDLLSAGSGRLTVPRVSANILTGMTDSARGGQIRTGDYSAGNTLVPELLIFIATAK